MHGMWLVGNKIIRNIYFPLIILYMLDTRNYRGVGMWRERERERKAYAFLPISLSPFLTFSKHFESLIQVQ